MVDLHRSGAHRVPLWSGGPGVGTSHAGQPKLPRTADFGSTLWHIYKASYKQALLKCFFLPYQSYQRSRDYIYICIMFHIITDHGVFSRG
jgi:hypothetical protein